MKSLRRWLATEGQIGEAPLWYTLIKAARYLGVPPWELAQRPASWVHMALEAQGAEAAARKSIQERKAGRNAHGG